MAMPGSLASGFGGHIYRDLTCEVKFNTFSGCVAVTRGLRQDALLDR